MAYERSKMYNERTKAYYNHHIKQGKEFKEGDKVLLHNARLKYFPIKLMFRWCGPFVVAQVLPYVTIEIPHSTKGMFKVNCHHLKRYLRGIFERRKVLLLHSIEN